MKVEVVLLPESLTRSQVNFEPVRYFMLAVDGESAYIKAATQLESDAARFDADISTKLKKNKGTLPPQAVEGVFDRLAALSSQLQALKVDPKEAIAVELKAQGIERVAAHWNTVLNVRECRGFVCSPLPPSSQESLVKSVLERWGLSEPDSEPTRSDPCTRPLASATQLRCLDNNESLLVALAAQEPPRLEDPMPVLPKLSEFAEPRVIRRYNAVVRRYNAEVKRRRQAQVPMLPSYAASMMRRAAALKGVKVTIRGMVRSLPMGARKTYDKIQGGESLMTSMSLREEGRAEETFVNTFYRKARYCISSNPPDSEIVVKGETVGRTPHCLDELVPGEMFELTVNRAGYAPVGIGPLPVLSSGSGAAEIECTLRKTASDGGGCKLFQ